MFGFAVRQSEPSYMRICTSRPPPRPPIPTPSRSPQSSKPSSLSIQPLPSLILSSDYNNININVNHIQSLFNKQRSGCLCLYSVDFDLALVIHRKRLLYI